MLWQNVDYNSSVNSQHRLFYWVVGNLESIPGDSGHKAWYTVARMLVHCRECGLYLVLLPLQEGEVEFNGLCVAAGKQLWFKCKVIVSIFISLVMNRILYILVVRSLHLALDTLA